MSKGEEPDTTTPAADTPEPIIAAEAAWSAFTSEEKRAMRVRRWARSLLRFLIYGGPVLVWMVFIFIGSTDLGRYENSWRFIIRVLNFLCPEFAQPETGEWQVNVSMYQINTAMRRLAHVVLYGLLTFLTVRALQKGKPRLRIRSLLAALLITIVYAGTDELHRYYQQNRHAKWSDITLNLYGIALVLGSTIFFFILKSWERKLEDPQPEPLPIVEAKPITESSVGTENTSIPLPADS